MVSSMEDNSSRRELLEQLWYRQEKISELEEKLDELELQNDDLRYKINEMESVNDEK